MDWLILGYIINNKLFISIFRDNGFNLYSFISARVMSVISRPAAMFHPNSH